MLGGLFGGSSDGDDVPDIVSEQTEIPPDGYSGGRITKLFPIEWKRACITCMRQTILTCHLYGVGCSARK